MVIYDKKAAQDIERSYQTPEIVRQRIHTLEALALRAGEQVLDAGCGTGLLVQGMSSTIGSQGRITGVDLSNDMLDVARNRCSKLDNIELQQGSVTELDFADNSFDAASCIQTLLYVDDVETALSELYRVLKPGGRIAILETDWRGVVLSSPDNVMTRKILGAWDATVSSPNLPVKLTPLLKKLNFGAVKTTAIPILNTSYSDANFSSSMLENFSDCAVKHAIITKNEAERWMTEIQHLAKNEAYFFCVNRFLFTAVKVEV
jgi:ubiquinone/menaquinone biosynthesis C-methylase UbiE